MDKYKFFKDVRAVNAGDQDELDQNLEFDQEKHKRRMAAKSLAEKMERIRKMQAQGMDVSAAMQDLERSKQGFQEGGMVGRDQFGTYPITEEDVIAAEQAKLNEAAKSPYQETKQERLEDTLIQEASKTPVGQAVVDAVQKPETDSMLEKYKKAISDYESKLNAPKKEYEAMDALPDILAGLYNIGVRANPTGLSEMQMPNSIQSAKAQEEASRSKDLSGLQNLQNMYAKYMEMQKKSGTKPATEKEKAETKLTLAKAKQLEKEASAPPEPTWEEKEQAKFDYQQKLLDKKERAKALKETETAISNVDEQLERIRRAKTLLAKAVQDNTVADTGPIDQYITGATDEGQQLRQAFNDLSLDKMTKMFKGMSKAIDSDAERKMFEQSQASLGNYPAVNKQILDTMERAALSLKQKNSQFMNELQSAESEKKSNEVRRKTKDGRIAIFDADTKQFLRYEQ